ncbi:alginate lyase family protein [Microbulbifer salipaludis]|uniref:Alginate lyase family protein n=1 Tax=Microbulbifer salipaludis TaxID=187980 RepID=A0ABS3E8Y2_9GAMM|nr:heparinase II/III family protein [Microbulbifer salipaludis]MBN8431782.1 alginate lyase family protein [Microbulbifer salipaludis]
MSQIANCKVRVVGLLKLLSQVSGFFLLLLMLPSTGLWAAQEKISLNNINLVYSSTYQEFKKLGFRPRKDVDPVHFDLPFDWSADPYDDRNWVFQLQAWRMIDSVLRQYRRTQDEKYLKEAFSIILDWHNYYKGNGNIDHMQWYDMATGIRAMKLAWLWQELANYPFLILPADAEKIRVLMRQHIEKLLDESFLAHGNHAYFQLVGLRLLCLAEVNSEVCSNESEYNSKKMFSLLERQFTGEGVHKENSPAYHFFTLKTIRQLNIQGLYGREVLELIDRASRVSPHLVYPNSMVARIGDSSGSYSADLNFYSEPMVLNGVKCQVGDFSKSGYFSIRTLPDTLIEDSSQLFITGISFSDEAHNHADELSFELFHRGELVFVDSGKYSYNKDEFRRYVISASAHNTLSLDGLPSRPQDVDIPGSKLISVNFSDSSVRVSGKLTRPGQFEHKRVFELKPFHLLEIYDDFHEKLSIIDMFRKFFNDYSLVSNLHVNPKLVVDVVSADTVEVPGYAIVKLKSEDCELNVFSGREKPLLGWVSFGYNEISPSSVIQARCPNSSGFLKWEISLL